MILDLAIYRWFLNDVSKTLGEVRLKYAGALLRCLWSVILVTVLTLILLKFRPFKGLAMIMDARIERLFISYNTKHLRSKTRYSMYNTFFFGILSTVATVDLIT